VRSGYAIVADRYTYLATIPLFIASSYPLARLRSASEQRGLLTNALSAALVAATVALGALSWQLTRTWHDSEAMVDRAAAAGTLSRPTYLMELGKFHEDRRQLEEAESCFREAVQLAPNRADVANALGGYLLRRQKLGESVAWFELAVEHDPRFVPGYNNLGLALAIQGRVEEAERQFEVALQREPYFVEARLNLASLLSHQGRSIDAAEHYARVLRVDPDNRRARAGLDALGLDLDRLMRP